MDGYELAFSVVMAVQDRLLWEAVMDERGVSDHNVQKLRSAMNSALCEVARDFPVLKKMSASAVDGVIPNPTGVSVACVYRVTRKGKPVSFNFDSLGIHVERDGDYDVVYSTTADCWEPYNDIAVPDYVCMEMLTQLVACNYCVMSGRPDEADFFYGRYEQHAEALRLKRRAKLRPRAFI
ncbi:MAG: hypothetical protein K2O39_04380 [Clostridiales bacterium]|nr:hypothetical protein [Clostridiales bacterium]